MSFVSILSLVSDSANVHVRPTSIAALPGERKNQLMKQSHASRSSTGKNKLQTPSMYIHLPTANPVTCLPPAGLPPPSHLRHHQENHARTRRLRRSRPPKKWLEWAENLQMPGSKAAKKTGSGSGEPRTIQTFNECGWQPPCTLAAV